MCSSLWFVSFHTVWRRRLMLTNAKLCDNLQKYMFCFPVKMSDLFLQLIKCTIISFLCD